jgi:hypothetical protein
MSDFSAAWLALREPVDRAARSATLARAVAAQLGATAPVRVLDLGSGTGANLRYLAPQLAPLAQEWLLTDRNPLLLRQAVARSDEAGANVSVTAREIDLTAPGWSALLAGRRLVTASALLDLVSERWLCTLAAGCRQERAAVLFALTYDGRIRCLPEDRDDAFVRELVNRHQRTDKGFGPALGPDAAGAAERCFTSVGYRTVRAPSDWVVTADRVALQRELIAGWAAAGAAVAVDHSAAIHAWRDRRMAHVAAGHSRIIVGHQDVAAWFDLTSPA